MFAAVALVAGLASAQESDDALAELTKAVHRAKGVEATNAALERIAALGAAGGHDAQAVTSALAIGLEREEVDVRVHAIHLLHNAPDRDRALDCLIAGSKQHHKRWVKMRQEIKPKKGRGKKAPDFLSDPKGYIKHIDEMQKNMGAILEKVKVMQAEAPVTDALFEALVAYQGESAVPGLVPLIDICGIGDEGKRVVAALFDQRGEAGLRAAVDYLKVPNAAVDEFVKAQKKAGKAKATRPPKYWKGSKDAWGVQERKRIVTRINEARKRVEGAVEKRDLYVSWLRERAKALDLPSTPPGAKYSTWKAWAKRAAKAASK